MFCAKGFSFLFSAEESSSLLCAKEQRVYQPGKRRQEEKGFSVLENVAETSSVPKSDSARAMHEWIQVLNEFLSKFRCIFIPGEELESSRS